MLYPSCSSQPYPYPWLPSEIPSTHRIPLGELSASTPAPTTSRQVSFATPAYSLQEPKSNDPWDPRPKPNDHWDPRPKPNDPRVPRPKSNDPWTPEPSTDNLWGHGRLGKMRLDAANPKRSPTAMTLRPLDILQMIQFCRAGRPEVLRTLFLQTKYRSSQEVPSVSTPEVCLLQVVLQTGDLETFQWVYERLPKAYRAYALAHFVGEIPNAELREYVQSSHGIGNEPVPVPEAEAESLPEVELETVPEPEPEPELV